MTKSTHGGKRKGAGRTQEYTQRLTLRLTDVQRETARRLGNGDESVAIRALLDSAAKKIPK